MKQVAIIMGSISDKATLDNTIEILDKFGVSYDTQIVSAHRTPDLMAEFAKESVNKYQLIIAAAGGAAHLPGMTASHTILPVIGVPIKTTNLDGMDSLLSIAQMPGGIPVATMAIGSSGATNAGLLAVRILALNDGDLRTKLVNYQQELIAKVNEMQTQLNSKKKAHK